MTHEHGGEAGVSSLEQRHIVASMRIPGNSLSGSIAGLALAPFTALISALRQSRMFHPSGLLCSADVEPLASSGPGAIVARHLTGPALVRWSSALWKRGEGIDVLGCAIRFSQAPLQVEPRPADQDLLLATIQRPWTMPLSPFTTERHDFLANRYYGVSPFETSALGRIEWRLSAEAPAAHAGSRSERLAAAIDGGSARLLLEWARYSGPLRRPSADGFAPLVRLRLTGLIGLDQEALRFDPFRTGRGVVPVGFVHSLRKAAYLASQASRPRSS